MAVTCGGKLQHRCRQRLDEAIGQALLPPAAVSRSIVADAAAVSMPWCPFLSPVAGSRLAISSGGTPDRSPAVVSWSIVAGLECWLQRHAREESHLQR